MEIWKLLKIWNREKETGQVWFKRRKPDLAPKQFPKPVCAITLYTIYSINVVLTYTSEWNYICMETKIQENISCIYDVIWREKLMGISQTRKDERTDTKKWSGKANPYYKL